MRSGMSLLMIRICSMSGSFGVASECEDARGPWNLPDASEGDLASAAPGGNAEQRRLSRLRAREHARVAAAQPRDRGSPADGEAAEGGPVSFRDVRRRAD